METFVKEETIGVPPLQFGTTDSSGIGVYPETLKILVWGKAKNLVATRTIFLSNSRSDI